MNGDTSGSNDLEDHHIGQSDPAQRAFALQRGLMLPHCLHNAERPAETLPHQSVRGGGRLGVGEGPVLVLHAVAGLEQCHCEIGIFGNGVVMIAAGRTNRGGSPRANRARNDAHCVHVFSARRSKFWLVMYSSACQRVQRFTRLPTLRYRP